MPRGWKGSDPMKNTARLFRRVSALLLCVLLLAVTACTKSGTEPEETTRPDVKLNKKIVSEIKDRGYLIAGCKMDVEGLGLYDEDTKTWSGLETELAYATAAKIFEVSPDEAKKQGLVRFKGVTVADRETKLEEGKIDVMMATYTITKERAKRFAISDSYYTDYIGIMVLDAKEDSNTIGPKGIKSIADLDGKKVGVAKNSTTREDLLNYVNTMNSIKVNPMFFEYASYDQLFEALQNGTIDAFCVDVSILNSYDDKTTKVLSDRFAGQHYGAAVLPENALLLDAVNAAIAEL